MSNGNPMTASQGLLKTPGRTGERSDDSPPRALDTTPRVPTTPALSTGRPMSDPRATLHEDTVLQISTAPTTTREENSKKAEDGEEEQVEIQV
jgi:hypothetical protein